MRFSGYENTQAILKLRSQEERNRMFNFAKSMSEIIEDKEEMFGIFKANPQKLMLIPGHEVPTYHFNDT